jgi:hypothetical protein
VVQLAAERAEYENLFKQTRAELDRARLEADAVRAELAELRASNQFDLSGVKADIKSPEAQLPVVLQVIPEEDADALDWGDDEPSAAAGDVSQRSAQPLPEFEQLSEMGLIPADLASAAVEPRSLENYSLNDDDFVHSLTQLRDVLRKTTEA